MKNLLFVLLCGFILMGCANPKKKLTSKVTELEKQLSDKNDSTKSKELIASYNTYIEQYPTDSTSRLYMAKGAEMSILNNDPNEALRFINLFLKTYPDDKRAGLMQFKKAMVYDILLHDGLRAVAEYQKFVAKYPDDPMRIEAENAILLIQNPETFMATFKEPVDSTTTVNNGK